MSSAKWKFEPSDFNYEAHLSNLYAAETANAKLEEWKREATVAYANLNFPPDIPRNADTHRALLIDIEELSKEPCKHEPLEKPTIERMQGIVRCKHCGVKLKATWEPAE